MGNTRFKVTFSFEKKSNQIIQSGLTKSEQHIGWNKGRKVTMYLALMALITAAFKFGTVALKLMM